MREIAVEVGTVIAFKEDMMRAGHVRGVQAAFNPARIIVVPGVVGVVVAENASRSARADDRVLARINKDVVFDQNFR